MLIAHISDLHVVSDDLKSRSEKTPAELRGNEPLRRNLATLQSVISDSDAIVVSGDITDTGSAGEWLNAFQLLDSLKPSAPGKLFVIPGNHDLNQVSDGSQWFVTDTPKWERRRLRCCLFALALSRYGKQYEIVKTSASGTTYLQSMESFLAPHKRLLEDLVDPLKMIKAVSALTIEFDELFPYIWRVECGDGLKVAFLGTNTVGFGRTVFDNAFGVFSVGSIASAAKHVIREGYFPIIVGHHHLLPLFEAMPVGQGKPGAFWKDFFQTLMQGGMVALYGERLVATLRDLLSEGGYLYLHGHRHISRNVTTSTNGKGLGRISGAPSMLFGDERMKNSCQVALFHTLTTGKSSENSPEIRTRKVDLSGKDKLLFEMQPLVYR